MADGIAKEPLEGVQIAPVPGYLDGVADGPFHPAGGGAEGFGYLRVEDFGDGVACLTARWGASKRENLLRCLCDLTTTVYWLTQMISKFQACVNAATYEY